MAKQSFLLVSLQEDKAKKLAQVVTNDSCRKILDYLADKEATETELAEKLGLPMSTVHYNLSQLVEAGLILADEFHYSKKGKEVNHYKLANKYIIIAPKSTFGIKEKLKSILPMVFVALVAGHIAQLFSRYFPSTDTQPFLMVDSAAAQKSFAAPALMMAEPAIETPFYIWIAQNQTYLWFAGGVLLSAAAFLILEYLRFKMSNK